MLEIFILLAALAILAKASDFTINNAVKFSKASGINQMTVGFIFIAVATSLPEFSIAVLSSLSGNAALSLGNLIGADISNLSLVFGAAAFIGFRIKKDSIEDISLAVILVSVVSVFLVILRKTDFAFGIFMLVVFYLFSRIVIGKGIKISEKVSKNKKNLTKLGAFIFLGIAIIVLSAHIVTGYAVLISKEFDLSETLIGATIIAIGTTLPELSVNIAAIRKKNVELAVGNSIGSIVTNMTLILGIASVISPINVGTVALAALLFLLFASAVFVFIANRLKFSRKEGTILIIIYLSYLLIMTRV